MSIEANQPVQEYKITCRPGLEDLTFTRSSKDRLAWPHAVKFCKDNGSILQSLREAVAFRHENLATSPYNDCQATRTVAIFCYENRKRFVALDDIEDPNENIVLARVQEAYDAWKRNRIWLLPRSDAQVKHAIERAQRSGRIVPIDGYAEIDVKLRLEDEFSAQPIAKAALGDMTETQAQDLIQLGYKYGRVRMPGLTFVEPDKADLRAVILRSSNPDISRFLGLPVTVKDSLKIPCCDALDLGLGYFREFLYDENGYGGHARGVRGTPDALKWRMQ